MKKSKHPTSNIQPPTSNKSKCEIWEFNEGGKENRRYDLEERLLEFASAVFVLSESDELMRIFFSSVQTAKRNALTERRKPTSSFHYPSGEAG